MTRNINELIKKEDKLKAKSEKRSDSPETPSEGFADEANAALPDSDTPQNS